MSRRLVFPTPEDSVRRRISRQNTQQDNDFIPAKQDNLSLSIVLAKSTPFHKLIVKNSRFPAFGLPFDGPLPHLFAVSRMSFYMSHQIFTPGYQKRQSMLITHRNLYTIISAVVQAKLSFGQGKHSILILGPLFLLGEFSETGVSRYRWILVSGWLPPLISLTG